MELALAVLSHAVNERGDEEATDCSSAETEKGWLLSCLQSPESMPADALSVHVKKC